MSKLIPFFFYINIVFALLFMKIAPDTAAINLACAIVCLVHMSFIQEDE